jgi:hypothetical protein
MHNGNSNAAPMVDMVRHPDGRFRVGHPPTLGGGRPPGSRDKFGQQFLEDLQQVWAELGIEALRRNARENPVAFVRSMVILQRPTVRELELERMQQGPMMTEAEIREAIIEGLPTIFPDLQVVARGKLTKR